MAFWNEELTRDALRYRRNVNKEYKTERGLWANQSSGSLECLSTTTDKLTEAIDEYKRSNDWD